MARIELFKAFDALDTATQEARMAKQSLYCIPERALTSGDYDNTRIIECNCQIDKAIAELQKAKQILTKDVSKTNTSAEPLDELDTAPKDIDGEVLATMQKRQLKIAKQILTKE